MPAYAYVILAAGWLTWSLPFLLRKRTTGPAAKRDRRARWGIALQAIGYTLLWQNRYWTRPLPIWRVLLSVLFFALANLLSWTAVRQLGRHWRIDAGLSRDHELVTSGPYRVVRHPIYTSML